MFILPLHNQRLLGADQVACDAIRQEIAVSKQLSGHPHIVEFIAAAAISKAQSKENRNEFLLLSELCTGGWVSATRRQVSIKSRFVIRKDISPDHNKPDL